MVAAQWGETRDPDARTGGGVSGRFRVLGGSGSGAGDAPDTAPPPFGTAPWGYRRSEVDAWASWVAGLVAHGRNETIRADSAEATLQATLERLEQLERPGAGDAAAPCPAAAGPVPTRDVGETPDAAAVETADTTPPETPGPRTSGRLHFDAPGDLPRRTPRATSGPDRAEAPAGPAAGTGPTSAGTGPQDHDLARLHVVETTLHEVLELLHRLSDRK